MKQPTPWHGIVPSDKEIQNTIKALKSLPDKGTPLGKVMTVPVQGPIPNAEVFFR